MKKTDFPPDWNEARVRRLLDHYEHQGEQAAAAEDEGPPSLTRRRR